MQVMFEPYFLLVTLHIILFAYWLGGDFGVFVCSRYIARPDLPVDERLRFLEALLAIDILPRTAIVLLPVVGIHMAYLRGSALISAPIVTLVWILGAAWVGVVYKVYTTRQLPSGAFWQKIDVIWRIILIVCLIGFGISSISSQWPVTEAWIGVKFIIYSTLLALGLYLRTTIDDWKKGFISLKKGETGPHIDALFIDARRRAKYAAFAFWTLVAVMGWLGITQPTIG